MVAALREPPAARVVRLRAGRAVLAAGRRAGLAVLAAGFRLARPEAAVRADLPAFGAFEARDAAFAVRVFGAAARPFGAGALRAAAFGFRRPSPAALAVCGA